MRTSIISFVALISACVVMSGCATMHYPGAYKVAGSEVKEFKELDDEKALKLVALIYNFKRESWEDDVARSIALQEYLGLLAKRKSNYIKKSGIFEINYKKVNLAKWSEEDIMKLYDILEPKAEPYYVDSAGGLSEKENTKRIVWLTAMSAVATEMKKRDNKRNAFTVAGQVLMGALTVVMALL